MPSLTPIILAAELGYDVTALKAGGSEGARFTLQKGERTVVIDQELINDIAAMASPVENPDEKSPIQAVS